MKLIIATAALMAASASQAQTVLCAVEDDEHNTTIAISDKSIDFIIGGNAMPSITKFKAIPGQGQFAGAITIFFHEDDKGRMVFPAGPSKGGLSLDGKFWYTMNCEVIGN